MDLGLIIFVSVISVSLILFIVGCIVAYKLFKHYDKRFLEYMDRKYPKE